MNVLMINNPEKIMGVILNTPENEGYHPQHMSLSWGPLNNPWINEPPS